MLFYIFLAVVAGIVQVLVIYSLKVGILKSFLYAAPFILLHQYIFLYNYLKAPNFIVIWFLTAAIAAILSFLLGYLVLKNPLSTYQLVGILCILLGMGLMKF